MLILSRKRGETIHIGDNVEIIVAEITGDKVRLVINAPKSVPVLRGELREIKNENRESLKATMADVERFLKKN